MHVKGPCNRSSSSIQAFIALAFAVAISGVLPEGLVVRGVVSIDGIGRPCSARRRQRVSVDWVMVFARLTASASCSMVEGVY